MIIILLSVIILLIIIFIFTYSKESFIIKPDTSLTTLEKRLEEIYNYPTCINQNKCLSSNNELKPFFKYNISDNRCIKNNLGYNSASGLNNIINYNMSNIPTYYSSCTTNYNSIYSAVIGKYIMIYRPDNTRIKFNYISVHERDTTIPSLSSATGTVTFSTNLYNNIYPEVALDSDGSITFENGELDNPPFSRIIITLPNDNNNIGYIKIVHSNNTDAATLNGARLFVLKKQEGSSDDNPYADIVFYKNINTTELDRVIYTYNFLNEPLPDGLLKNNIKINNDWILPCTNCSSMYGKLFKYHTYTKNDTRCYVPILNNIDLTDISVNEPDILTLSTRYKSCNNLFSTHYPIPNGQLIYITKTNNLPLHISKIELYSNYNLLSYGDSLNNDLCVYIKNYSTNDKLFENIIDSNNSNFFITDGIFNPIILINVNNNINISAIRINSQTTYVNNLIDLKIYIIKINTSDPFNYNLMRVTGYYNITINDIITSPSEVSSISTYLFSLNYINNNLISNYSDISLPISVNYDINNKYLTTYKKNNIYYQVPYLNYIFSNGRSILAKSIVDSINTLDKISISDPDLLFNFNSQNNITTNIIGQNTELLPPISSRYVQIIANTSLIDVISNITIYNNQRNIIKSTNNPYPIYTISHSTYTSYLTSDIQKINQFTGNGNIIIDIGENTLISFITIQSSIYSQLNGNILYLINNNNIRKFTYTFSNIINNTTILVIDTTNETSISGSYILNKYDYPSCLIDELCRYVNPNSYYILQNTCFLSNPDINTTKCNTSCMRTINDYLLDDTIEIINNNFSTCIESTDTRSFITALLWNSNNLYNILDVSDNFVPILESSLDPNLSFLILNVSGNTLSTVNKSSTTFTETVSNVSIVNQDLLSVNYGTLFSSIGYIDFVNTTVLTLPNLFTIQFWCKFNSAPDSNDIHRTMFNLGDSSYNRYLLLTKAALILNRTRYNIPDPFLINTWYYIKLIRNESNSVILYINGVEKINISNITINFNSIGDRRQLRLLNAISVIGFNLNSMNGYIADFKMYKSYSDPNPTFVPTRRIYDVFQGNIVDKWISNRKSIYLSSYPPTNSLSARTTLNKNSIKKTNGSIMYIVNGETLLNKVKVISTFLVYSVVNPPTSIYLLLEFNFSQMTINSNILYITCKNESTLELSSTLSNTGTIISNYTSPVSNMDILGIQITFSSTYVNYKFINTNTPSIINRNINNNATVSDLTTTLRNIYIGGMVNGSFNGYFNYGVEMNIYEIFISGTVLSDSEFNSKYTELYNRWIL